MNQVQIRQQVPQKAPGVHRVQLTSLQKVVQPPMIIVYQMVVMEYVKEQLERLGVTAVLETRMIQMLLRV